jgi:hypothetical protein
VVSQGSKISADEIIEILRHLEDDHHSECQLIELIDTCYNDLVAFTGKNAAELFNILYKVS